jgi:uncharacterized membrane protein YraQ (UPF0718 family)
MNQILHIANYMLENLIHTWPYLLITIPIAVGVNMSGMSKYIHRSFTARPILAIFLAAFLGAFSPLCSASVIPVVAALLIGGVPLAPVMSFWLASPSMDPEMFFLTVSVLGWELAVWRLVAALFLSLGGGFVTHNLVQRGMLGTKILRDVQSTEIKSMGELLKQSWESALEKINSVLAPRQEVVCMTVDGCAITLPNQQLGDVNPSASDEIQGEGINSVPCDTIQEKSYQSGEFGFWKRLGKETWDATTLVIKFMLLAWFIGALIHLYMPEAWIISTLGDDKNWAIIAAALLGIPMYTSNLAVMPLIGGLLAGGMHPGAALAFLIAGPVTTLPAMSAVWGLVNRRVFALYLGFSLVGAVAMGYAYSFTL